LAVSCVATAAGFAGSVFAPEEPDPYSLADLPSRDAWTNFLDATDCFVARNTWIYDAGELCFNGAGV
jgi:hypothetical protein